MNLIDFTSEYCKKYNFPKTPNPIIVKEKFDKYEIIDREKIKEGDIMKNFYYKCMTNIETEKCLVLICPIELYEYKIMQDNMNKMEKYVWGYVKAVEQYNFNNRKILDVPFDCLKEKYTTLRDDSQRIMDLLIEKMNKGISPYGWYYYKKYKYKIDCGVKDADYYFVLEKI